MYRPCYATLVSKVIRGKYRIYLHLTIEGKAKPKYNKFSHPRHKFEKGIIMKKYSGEIIEIFLWIITFCLNIVAYFKHSNALFLIVVVLCIANIGVRLLTIKRK